jgi:hypothetical protein
VVVLLLNQAFDVKHTLNTMAIITGPAAQQALQQVCLLSVPWQRALVASDLTADVC